MKTGIHRCSDVFHFVSRYHTVAIQVVQMECPSKKGLYEEKIKRFSWCFILWCPTNYKAEVDIFGHMRMFHEF